MSWLTAYLVIGILALFVDLNRSIERVELGRGPMMQSRVVFMLIVSWPWDMVQDLAEGLEGLKK